MIDLMTYLSKSYKESESEHQKLVDYLMKNGDEKGVKNICNDLFVDFCKQHLKGNPPVSVFMAPYGLGVRMADDTEVTLLEPPVEEIEVPASIPITKPKSIPGQFGISDTKCVPVFGGSK